MYHISIAWAGVSCEMDPALFKMLQTEFAHEIEEIKIDVRHVKLKIGNEITTVSLE